jgi:hypothetical protein
MGAYEAVKTWVYSGGDEVAPMTFEQGMSDAELAIELQNDWHTWSEGQCPFTVVELTDGFAQVREELAQ